MCPDRQIISLYFDKELPSPWKEKMAAHMGTCPLCQAALAGYQNIGKYIGKPDDEAAAAAQVRVQDRVWKKISESRDGLGHAEKTIYRQPGSAKWLWNRRITLPVPAAAAALAVFVAFFALLGVRSPNQPLPQTPVAAMNMSIGFDDYALVPIHDINDVIRYLSIQDNADFMVIRLPEHRSFSRAGQPALINAVDYSMARRNFHR